MVERKWASPPSVRLTSSWHHQQCNTSETASVINETVFMQLTVRIGIAAICRGVSHAVLVKNKWVAVALLASSESTAPPMLKPGFGITFTVKAYDVLPLLRHSDPYNTCTCLLATHLLSVSTAGVRLGGVQNYAAGASLVCCSALV
jgi:hypothetical protein